jgi:hypothetical protein
MSRYQKHFGFATFRGVHRAALICVLASLIALIRPVDGFAAPARQLTSSNIFPAYYLMPLGSTTVELHTHTADFLVVDDPVTGLAATLDARYRLDNPGDEPTSVQVRVATMESGAEGALAVTANGGALALTPADDGSYTTEVTVPAEGRVDLLLRSSAQLDERRLPALHYAVRNLFGWPGRASLRVSVTMPNAIASESWLTVAPDGWSFSPAPSGQQTMIKWLYEGDWPTTPVVFQFVHPDVWQEARRADVAAGPGMPMETFLTLGNLYTSLYAETLDDRAALGDSGERFYAQALAAYAAGVTEGEARGLPAADLALLHAGMATLYRSRITDAAGAVDPTYAELMVRAAGSALAGLPADHSRVQELQQWRADGLRQMVAEARRRGDWASVATLLEQMVTLPPGLVAPESLAEERQMATVQQALQLLQQGNREAATTLAGPEVVAAALAPQTSFPLAASWQVTVTIAPDGATAVFTADVLPEGVERALTAFGDQEARWQGTALPDGATVTVDQSGLPDGLTRWRFTMLLPDREAALALAQSLPPNPDWALMRTLLQQIAPDWVNRSGLLRRSMQVSQQYDFGVVTQQWQAQADLLEQQAAEFDTQRALSSAADVSAAAAALQASVQAVNYRTAAQLWQNLLESAAVVTQMEAPDGFGTAQRIWLTTLTAPAQPQTLQVTGPNPVGVLFLLLLGVVVLFLVSGLLWQLL